MIINTLNIHTYRLKWLKGFINSVLFKSALWLSLTHLKILQYTLNFYEPLCSFVLSVYYRLIIFTRCCFFRLFGRSFHGWRGLRHSKLYGGHQQVECGGCVWLHKQPGWMCWIHTGETIGRGRSETERRGMEVRGRLTTNHRGRVVYFLIVIIVFR